MLQPIFIGPMAQSKEDVRMNAEFPRLITLLRKEKGISQKQAAAELGISQALLSHYEKGVRECGLDFLIRCSRFYHVSCDYLLGLSPERSGRQLTVEEIPEPENTKDTVFRGNIMPVLNKKLITNSLGIIYDLIGKSESKQLNNEISNYLMLAVYRGVPRALFGQPQKRGQHVLGAAGDAQRLLLGADDDERGQGAAAGAGPEQGRGQGAQHRPRSKSPPST